MAENTAIENNCDSSIIDISGNEDDPVSPIHGSSNGYFQSILENSGVNLSKSQENSMVTKKSAKEESHPKSFLHLDHQTILKYLKIFAEKNNSCDDLLEDFVIQCKVNYLHVYENINSARYKLSIKVAEKNESFDLADIPRRESAFLDDVKNHVLPEWVADKLVIICDAMNVKILYGQYMIANIVREEEKWPQKFSKFLILKVLKPLSDKDKESLNDEEKSQAISTLKEILNQHDASSDGEMCLRRILFILEFMKNEKQWNTIAVTESSTPPSGLTKEHSVWNSNLGAEQDSSHAAI